ncbi:hypothetical protein HZH68_015963 [Vespula germanica]|uniref:Uncharacterized protein n=1 Tax=Vespula germanica TaxID=30212 RepID=A0A834J2Z2_VESGE|nr:hypothetical protein HZH68_015963 [Vespula germanica]
MTTTTTTTTMTTMTTTLDTSVSIATGAGIGTDSDINAGSSNELKGKTEKNRKDLRYLCEPHGCKPTSPCLFAVEGDDLEPVLPTLRVFGLSVASWPQTGAPLEGRVKTPPCVWNSVYVIVRQMSEGV